MTRNPALIQQLKVLNHIVVDEPQQVLLEVKVAQVDKTALKSLGISTFVKGKSAEGFVNRWGRLQRTYTGKSIGLQNIAPGIAGDTPWIGSISPLTTYQLGGSLFKTGLGGVLKALATKNLAKMLAEPNLLVKSGQRRQISGRQQDSYPGSLRRWRHFRNVNPVH